MLNTLTEGRGACEGSVTWNFKPVNFEVLVEKMDL
jgi:hypothetical protein